MKTIYLDLDGTLLGKNSSLLHTGAGDRTNIAVDTLRKIEETGNEVVVATGRTKEVTFEFCRSIGLTKYIGELGSIIHTDDSDHYNFGDEATRYMETNSLDPQGLFQHTEKAARLLIENFSGNLESHDPHNRNRFATFLLRGNVDLEKANHILVENNFEIYELIANGHGRFRVSMPNVENVIVYHLAPKGTTKATGIKRDQEIRRLKKENCFMVGDGLADLQCYEYVNKVFVPSNGPLTDPDVETYARAHENIILLDKSHNEGFAQAVDLIV
ncbi:MAG: HAD hydrolase family protein [Acidimicrobiia bacterium]